MPRAAAAAAQAYFFAPLYGLLKFVDESSGLANRNTMPKYGRQCGQSFRLAQSFDDAVVVHLVPFKAGQLVLKRQRGERVLDQVVRVVIVCHVGCDSASGAIDQDNHRGCKKCNRVLLTSLLVMYIYMFIYIYI